MKRIKGDRLVINLPATQVRRTLKRFGHGVRKVESGGRGRAVIVHTATGEHLRELRALFGDHVETAEKMDPALRSEPPTPE